VLKTYEFKWTFSPVKTWLEHHRIWAGLKTMALVTTSEEPGAFQGCIELDETPTAPLVMHQCLQNAFHEYKLCSKWLECSNNPRHYVYGEVSHDAIQNQNLPASGTPKPKDH